MITKLWYDLTKKTEDTFFYAAWWFVGINIAIHLYRVFHPEIVAEFALRPSEILERPWTLFTAMFLHSDFEHILQNMLALFIFGIILEKVIGSVNWIFIYVASGLIGNLIGIVVYPDAISLGASGAITGVVGALAVLRPKMMIYLGGPLPMIVLAGVWVVINLAGFFNPTDNIGYAVHLTGYATGIIYGFIVRPAFKEEDMLRKKVDIAISEDEFRKFEDDYVVEKKTHKRRKE